MPCAKTRNRINVTAWDAMNRDPQTEAVTGHRRSHDTVRNETTEQLGIKDITLPKSVLAPDKESKGF